MPFFDHMFLTREESVGHWIYLCRNVIHGSDSTESARKEIALWFPDGPANWQSSLHHWVYE